MSGHVAVEYISQLNALAADAERAVRTDSLLDRIEAFLSRTLGVLEATEETGELGRCCLGGSAPPRRLNTVGSFNREVLMLNEIKKWTPSQLKAIYWFATPKVERKPRFQKEFAETLGVREETISRWKNDPDLSAEVGRVARAELGKDLPEVYGTLRKMAIRGSFQHMKLYLELLEEHREEVDINFIDKRRKLREELLELERKRRESAPPRGLGRADEAS